MTEMKIVLDSQIHFPLTCPYKKYIKDLLTYDNPEYEDAKYYAKNKYTKENVHKWVSKELTYYEEDNLKSQIHAPVGVKNYLLYHCQTCHYQCSVEDNRSLGQPVEASRVMDPPITLRPSQAQAIDAVEKTIAYSGGGSVKMPTGTGKTLLLFKIHEKAQLGTLFITYTIDLANQTFNEYKRRYGVEPGYIGDGYYKIDPIFTVAIINSLYAKRKTCIPELNAVKGLVEIDECHRLPIKQTMTVLDLLEMKYRVGVSATFNRGDGKGDLILKAIGPTVFQLSIDQAIAEGSLVPLKIEYLETDYKIYATREEQKKKFNTIANEAAVDMGRNLKIARRLEERCYEGHVCIAILQNIEQCNLLYQLLESRPYVRPAIFVGITRGRDKIVNDAKAGKINVLLTVKLAGIGLDIPRADTLLIDQKIKDDLAIEQFAGRVARTCPDINKTEGLVIDVTDIRVPIFLNQTRARAYIYRKFDPHRYNIVRA